MRRTIIDAIIKAYHEYAKPNITDASLDTQAVQLLVQFKLGDLKYLEKAIYDLEKYSTITYKA